MRRLFTLSASLTAAMLLMGAPARATDFSFTGTFTQDDDVQLFSFTVGGPSSVTFRTYSYAGGTNSAGTLIPRGGFDPILALFDSTGALIDQNDDGSGVPGDPLSGADYDTLLTALLDAGTYTVSVMQYNNFANGPNLSDGFERQGDGNFTTSLSSCDSEQGQFLDVSGSAVCARTGFWAFDILNVASADVIENPPTGIPEPSSLALVGAALAAVGFARRRR